MSQKIYLWILRFGIVLSFPSVLIVSGSFLFPYITGKQLYFNILIEIIVVFWLAFIIKYPQWNPFRINKKGITFGLIAFFLVMLISSFTGVDFNLSFWGDIERMLGFFQVVHFLFLYLIIITVLRDWEDWKWILSALVVIAMIVGLTGIFGAEAHGTVGNKAYMAGFMIFGLFFSLLLIYKEKQYWRWLYLVPLVIMFWAFKNANITGAFAGLGGSILVFLFCFGVLTKEKRYRLISLGLLILIISSLAFAFTNKDNFLVQKIDPIQNFSLEENTLQTRFISWRAAWQEFPNYAIIGTGYGNFATVFDKHFPPEFYDYARSGTYFDRAHNNLIDIAVTMGLLGLITYLSIFIFVLIYLWQAKRRDRIDMFEFSLLLSLFAAYFVQNLAVFDSLPTYIGLMLLLGLVVFIANTNKENSNKQDLFIQNKDRKLINKEIYVLAGTALVILIFMILPNIKSIQMLSGTIEGQKALARGNVEQGVRFYREALGSGSFLNRDSRDAFVKAIISYSEGLQNVPVEKRKEVLTYAVELADKNLDYNREDTMAQVRLAQVLNFSARYLAEIDSALASQYSDRAKYHIDRAIETSPGRINLYITKAEVFLSQGEVEPAIETLKQGKELNKTFEPILCQLAEVYLLTEQDELGFDAMEDCLTLGGISSLRFSTAIKKAINYYIEQEELDTVRKLYERLSRVDRGDSEVWIKLAQLYYSLEEFDLAKEAAEQAVQLNPELRKDMAVFLQELNQALEATSSPK